MRCSRTVLLSLALLVVVALAGPAGASAKRNPYTGPGVCGPGYKAIDRHKLVDGNNGILLAEVVLSYKASTGQNCVVTLKRYRIGLKTKYYDNVYADLYTKPLSTPGNTTSDQGSFAYFAGPVYVTARSKCVQWGGGADLWAPSNWHPRGVLHSAFRSGWTHCG